MRESYNRDTSESRYIKDYRAEDYNLGLKILKHMAEDAIGESFENDDRYGENYGLYGRNEFRGRT